MKKDLKLDFWKSILLFVGLIVSSCTTESINEDFELDADPIVGKWFLKTINDTNVSDVDCYLDSFIDSNGETITFFLQDRLENGDCETVLNNTQELTIEEGFYYLGDEAIEIYIDGNELSWRVDKDNTLEFKK